MPKFTHIDLFSGIGGFAYAANQVWGEDYQPLFFCDIDKFCQAVLRKNFGKDILIYEDIKKINKKQVIRDITNAHKYGLQKSGQGEQASGNRQFYEDATIPKSRPQLPSDEIGTIGGKDTRSDIGGMCCNDASNPCNDRQFRGKKQNIGQIQSERQTSRWDDSNGCNVATEFGRVDLLTAGPPCQPASHAGKRQGTKDNRWLWTEMFKVIQEFKPTWCIIENVYGLITLEQGVVFESLCAEMETLGYEVQPFVIGAVGKNAVHKRYRVWIIAHAKGDRSVGESGRIREQEQRQDDELLSESDNADKRIASDTNRNSCYEGQSRRIGGKLSEAGKGLRRGPSQGETREEFGNGIANASYPKHEGYVGRGGPGAPNGERIQESQQTGEGTRGATPRCNEEHPDVGDSERTGLSGAYRGQGEVQHGGASESGFEGWGTSWYEVATEFCGISNGFSDWMERYFDRVIFKEDYATTTKENRTKNLQVLREAIHSEEIWKKLGRLFSLDEKEILLSFLCRIEKGTNKSNDISFESKESDSKNDVRNLWKNTMYRHTSQRRKYQKQFCGELTNIVPSLSYEIALEITKIWDYFQCAYSSMISKGTNDYTQSKHRENRLKALGNAVVPPLVMEFFKMIKQIEETADKSQYDFKTEKVKHLNIDERDEKYIVMKDLRNY